VINGVIAWFVFRGEQSVLLAGSDTIFKMLLPMSFIESTLTSFFGVLGGTHEIRTHSTQPCPIRWRRWFVLAVGFSLLQGLAGYSLFAAAMFVCRWMELNVSIPGYLVAPLVGLISGVLAYLMHSHAVIRSVRILELCRPVGAD
jgi:H+/Cl- antiporter ClcA